MVDHVLEIDLDDLEGLGTIPVHKRPGALLMGLMPAATEARLVPAQDVANGVRRECYVVDGLQLLGQPQGAIVGLALELEHFLLDRLRRLVVHLLRRPGRVIQLTSRLFPQGFVHCRACDAQQFCGLADVAPIGLEDLQQGLPGGLGIDRAQLLIV